jgi:hypothetical protein
MGSYGYRNFNSLSKELRRGTITDRQASIVGWIFILVVFALFIFGALRNIQNHSQICSNSFALARTAHDSLLVMQELDCKVSK